MNFTTGGITHVKKQKWSQSLCFNDADAKEPTVCGGNVHCTDQFMVAVKYVFLQSECGNVVGDLFSQPQHLVWFCLILPNIILGKEIAWTFLSLLIELFISQILSDFERFVLANNDFSCFPAE